MTIPRIGQVVGMNPIKVNPYETKEFLTDPHNVSMLALSDKMVQVRCGVRDQLSSLNENAKSFWNRKPKYTLGIDGHTKIRKRIKEHKDLYDQTSPFIDKTKINSEKGDDFATKLVTFIEKNINKKDKNIPEEEQKRIFQEQVRNRIDESVKGMNHDTQLAYLKQKMHELSESVRPTAHKSTAHEHSARA